MKKEKKVYPHACGAKGGNQAIGKKKGGLTPRFTLRWMHIVTEGTRADCKMAIEWIQAMPVQYLMADRAYDTNVLIEYLQKQNAQAVIPPKRNRKTKRKYDKVLYAYCYLVENAFLKFKQFRGIATRYAKSVFCFAGAIHLASIVLWLKCLV